MKNKKIEAGEGVNCSTEPVALSESESSALEENPIILNLPFEAIIERHFMSKEAFNAFYNIKE